ncbi:MAG: MmcB family DNA repair protein [Pseudomonadota bacterium]
MPLFQAFDVEPMVDGRQSAAALRIRRGVARLLREMGFGVVPELTLPSGHRADIAAVGTAGEIWIVEIKSSLADYRADAKWPVYRRACDRLYFATTPDVGDIFPPAEGLILTDGFAAEMLREAPLARLAAPARKAMTLRMAQAAARRLHELEDPSARIVVPDLS